MLVLAIDYQKRQVKQQNVFNYLTHCVENFKALNDLNPSFE